MGTIYEIICWTTGLRYIGQTTQSLKRRLADHKCHKKCSSKLVLEHGNYEIYELEKMDNKTLLKEREKYYIQHTDCVNILTGYGRNILKRRIPYKCECGKMTKRENQARHRKTKFHQNFLAL